MELWHIAVIFVTGIFAGFVNTLAGGGSLLTLPVLIFMGLPTSVANGTNRLAITVQSMFAVTGFQQKGIANFKRGIIMSLPTIIGAVVGAKVAVNVSDLLFKRILAGVMLLVLGTILWSPFKKKQDTVLHNENVATMNWCRYLSMMVLLFFIGIYGGFIQAGIGLLIIAVFTTLGGYNLVQTNSHKVFIIGVNAFFALIIFIFHDKINWLMGITLSAGTGLGGWFGSHFAVTRGEKFIRIVLLVCVVGMVIKLLYP